MPLRPRILDRRPDDVSVLHCNYLPGAGATPQLTVFIRLAVRAEDLAWLQKCTKPLKTMTIKCALAPVVTFIIHGTSSGDSRLTKYICYKFTTWLSIALTIFVTFRCQAITNSC